MKRVIISLLSLLLLVAPGGCAWFGGADEVEVVEIRRWPREYAGKADAKLVVYQPQVISWTDHEEVEARAALAFTRNQGASPALGTMRFRAKTESDLETRRVRLSDFEMLEVRFPTLSEGEQQLLAEKIEEGGPATWPAASKAMVGPDFYEPGDAWHVSRGIPVTGIRVGRVL